VANDLSKDEADRLATLSGLTSVKNRDASDLLGLWPLLGADALAVLAAPAIAGSGFYGQSFHSGGATGPIHTAAGITHKTGCVTGIVTTATLSYTPVTPGPASLASNDGAHVPSPQPAAASAAPVLLSTAVSEAFRLASPLIPATSSAITAVSADNAAPVASSTELSELIDSLDTMLSQLSTTLVNEFFGQVLPVLGQGLQQAYQAGQTALTAFAAFGTAMDAGLQSLGSLASPTAAAIASALNDALESAGYGRPVSISLDSTNGLIASFDDTIVKPFSQTIDPKFGTPGLEINADGTVTGTLTSRVDLSGTISPAGQTSYSQPDGSALIESLHLGDANFFGNASVGNLSAAITDPNQGTHVDLTATLDTQGDASLSGTVDLGVHVATTVKNFTPVLGADILGEWDFAADNLGADINTESATPTLSIDNLTLDLGPMVDNFVRPVLDAINPVLQPLKNAITFLTTDISAPFKAIMGDDWTTLIPGGPPTDGSTPVLTMIDLLEDATGQDLTELQKFLQALNIVATVAQVVDGLVTPSTLMNLGSYSLPAGTDVRGSSFDIAQVVPVTVKAADSLTAALAGLSGSGTAGSQAANALSSLTNGANFSFPLLQDGSKALQFLFGGDSDVFDANLSFPTLGLGTVTGSGAPGNTVSIPGFPFPLPFPGLSLDLGFALQVASGINIGFDTSGLSAYAQGGFQDQSLIGNGLFISNPVDSNNNPLPILSFSGAIELAVEAGLGVIASIGGGGDIGGVVNFSLTNPGKTYINQLQSEIANNPFSVFTASGDITAGLDAAVKLFGQNLLSWNSPRLTLLTFNSAAANGLPSATNWVGGDGNHFEDAKNWSPSFALDGGNEDYYGNATIDSPDFVVFDGPVQAFATSLTITKQSELDVKSGLLIVDGSAKDSVNAGTLAVYETGTLELGHGVTNTGTIELGLPNDGEQLPTLTLIGLVDLSGGGTVVAVDQSSIVINGISSSVGDAPQLWNRDNHIGGSGTIAVPVLNQGTITSDGTNFLWLMGSVGNAGLLEAVGNGFTLDGSVAAGLRIEANVDNAGGTIMAGDSGVVLLDNGVTITGGDLLSGSTGAVPGQILINGAVTLAGGTNGLRTGGDITAGLGGVLTLTGLIAADPTFGSPDEDLASAGGTIVLQDALLRNGFLNASPVDNPIPFSPPFDGAIVVSGSATLDGAAGAGVLGLEGTIQVGGTDTLTLDGTIDPGGLAGGGIAMSGGTLAIGNDLADGADLDTGGFAFSAAPGTLLLSNSATVVGFDAQSVLTNSWLVSGSGGIGGGSLRLVNAGGTIVANAGDMLTVQAGPLSSNAGFIGTEGGVLDLGGTIGQSEGSIDASGGSIVLDGAFLTGGVLQGESGAVVTSMNGGSLSSVVVIADASTIDLDGMAIHGGTLLAEDGGTIVVTNAAAVADVTVLAQGGTVILGGDTIAGGTLSSSGTGVVWLANGTSLDSTTDPIAVSSGTVLARNGSVTLAGSLINSGTFGADGGAGPAKILLDGGVSLSGGGTFLLANDGSAATVVGSDSTAELVNTDNLIMGSGSLGGGTLTLLNGASGHIVGDSGTLVVDTGAVPIVNLGIMGARASGVLDVHGTIGNALGTIGVGAGTSSIDGAALLGGVLDTTGGGTVTFDGTGVWNGVPGALNSAATIAAGAQAQIDPGATVTLTGTLADQGTLTILGNGLPGQNGELLLSGLVRVAGTGDIALALNSQGGIEPDLIGAAPGGGTLDHVSGTISGGGGIQLNAITNEAGALFDGGSLAATDGPIRNFGTMQSMGIDSPLINSGLMQALGTSIFDTGGFAIEAAVTNLATIQAVFGGMLITSPGTVFNSGIVLAGNDGQIVLADGGAIVDNGGTFHVLTGGKLEFAKGFVSGGTILIDAGGSAVVDPEGTIANAAVVNHAQIAIEGDASNNSPSSLLIAGTVTLSGGGTVAMTDSTGQGDQGAARILSAAPGAVLANQDNTIAGYGILGDGTLVIQDGKAATIAALGGTMTLRGTIDDTAGGTVIAKTILTTPGTIMLDGAVLEGGLVATGSATDASMLAFTGNGGTLDGTGAGLTLAAGVRATVDEDQLLTMTGTIDNEGSVLVQGNLGGGETYGLRIRGATTLTGAGTVDLVPGFLSPAPPVGVTGTLTNDSTIIGNGSLGDDALQFDNGTAGVVVSADLNSGMLTIDTGTVGIVNDGLLIASDSELNVLSDLSGSGTLETTGAFDQGGIIQLETITMHGGTYWNNPADPGDRLYASDSTFDGGSEPVTIMQGAEVGVPIASSLTLTGTIDNKGSIALFQNGIGGQLSTLYIAGTVTLSGGGVINLHDFDRGGGAIAAAGPGAVLDNEGNTIFNDGSIGFGQLAIVNGTLGTIDARSDELVVDTGSLVLVNRGVLSASLGGVLILPEAINNKGGTIAASGTVATGSGVLIDGGTIEGGTLMTGPAGVGQSIQFSAAGGELDGTTEGAVTIASGAQIYPGVAGVFTGQIVNRGTIILQGDGISGIFNTLEIAGHTTLSGGGTIAITDPNGGIIGKGSAWLDNVDNTIAGFGSVGAGSLPIVNESGGTVAAVAGTMMLDAGTGTIVNRGQMLADTGILDMTGAVDNAGGTIAASSDAGSLIQMDAGTIIGGTIETGGAGSNLLAWTGNDALDGRTSPVTVRGIVNVGGSATLSALGSIAISDTLAVAGAFIDTGTVLANQVIDDAGAGYPNSLVVSGSHALLDVTGDLLANGSGVGNIVLQDGATVKAGTVEVAGQPFTSGSIDLEGASTLDVTGTLTIGLGGYGSVSVGTGSTLSAASIIVDFGVLSEGGDPISAGSIGVTGEIQATSGVNTLTATGMLSNNGLIDARTGATETIDTPAIGGTGQFYVYSDANLFLNAASVAGTQVVTFDGTAGGTVTIGQGDIPGFHAQVQNFQSGDVINLPGVTGFSTGLDDTDTQLTVFSNGASLGVLDFQFAITPDVAAQVECFAAGTPIRADRGDVTVEDLREGDLVWSVLSERWEPVIWIGVRTVDCRAHPKPERVWPVRVAAGAFGAGVPERDVCLSPDHAVYVDGVLIPVKALINGTTIRRETVDTVTYYHVELRQHDVLLAAGLPAESYLDAGDRAGFSNGGGVTTLHPCFGDVWETQGCAPIVQYGPVLRAVRARLAA
jgi:hypothetical protein